MLPRALGGVSAGLLATHYLSLGILILSGMAWLPMGLGLDLPRPGAWLSLGALGAALWQGLAVAGSFR